MLGGGVRFWIRNQRKIKRRPKALLRLWSLILVLTTIFPGKQVNAKFYKINFITILCMSFTVALWEPVVCPHVLAAQRKTSGTEEDQHTSGTEEDQRTSGTEEDQILQEGIDVNMWSHMHMEPTEHHQTFPSTYVIQKVIHTLRLVGPGLWDYFLNYCRGGVSQYLI